MSKGSDLLVAALAGEGVARVFGVPGEENLDVVESLRQAGIEHGLTRHDPLPTIEAAFKGCGVHLVDVQIDYGDDLRVLVDELEHRVEEIEVA